METSDERKEEVVSSNEFKKIVEEVANAKLARGVKGTQTFSTPETGVVDIMKMGNLENVPLTSNFFEKLITTLQSGLNYSKDASQILNYQNDLLDTEKAIILNIKEDISNLIGCDAGCTAQCLGCSSACDSNCDAGCYNQCKSNCGGNNCTDNCGASCDDGCSTNCSTTCGQTCKGGCSGCSSGCSSGCTGLCRDASCIGGCRATCETYCDNTATNTGKTLDESEKVKFYSGDAVNLIS